MPPVNKTFLSPHVTELLRLATAAPQPSSCCSDQIPCYLTDRQLLDFERIFSELLPPPASSSADWDRTAAAAPDKSADWYRTAAAAPDKSADLYRTAAAAPDKSAEWYRTAAAAPDKSADWYRTAAAALAPVFAQATAVTPAILAEWEDAGKCCQLTKFQTRIL
jgi:hypothetical protein